MTSAPARAVTGIALILASLAAPGCSGSPREPAIAAPPRAKPPVEITLLYTSDEHGWVLPFADKGTVRGGAAEMLARWISVEGHCARGDGACADPATLALSGGDNYTGPALSTYFQGAPMAEALGRMGYAASALGNHELDFGRIKFIENSEKSGVKYLSSNLVAPPDRMELGLPGFAMFERRGVKIGVVGVSTHETLVTAMASRFMGAEFAMEEPSLDRDVGAAWAAGADAVVVIAHECPEVLAPIVARHPEWRLSFAGAGHCHKRVTERAGDVALISPGWRFEAYARVRLRVDPSRPARSRVVSADASIVEVARDEGAPPLPADPEIARVAAAYKSRLDRDLGEPIGFTASAIDKDAPELARWFTRAIRESTGADVAILNTGGIRQSLPAGTITKATVWSILPFDNKVVEVDLKGSDLLENLGNTEVIASGVSRGPGAGWVTLGSKPLDPASVYKVATLDFLYLGGAHFTFRARALRTVERGVDWRAMVIDWTAKQHTSPEAPLDRRLREADKPKR